MVEDRPGTKIAEQMMSRPDGATMDEVIAATGGPQYNVLRRLEGRGYRIRKVRRKGEQHARYFAKAPATPSYEAEYVTDKGQVTIPQEIRERLRLGAERRSASPLKTATEIVVTNEGSKLSDLFGILGKPPRSLTLKEMDEVIAQAAVDRYLRSSGRKKR